MRLEALLLAAGLAVATAGNAVASPINDDCEHKSWLAEMVCKAAQPAQAQAQTQTQPAHDADVFAYVRTLMRPRSAFDWFRVRLDQLGNKTMISSSTRPSTRPAATAPSDVGQR
jgi:hypothetical protein